jgi:LacI family transcriptional regulator
LKRATAVEAVQAVGHTRRAGSKSESVRGGSGSSSVLDLVVTHFEGSWANPLTTGVGREAAAAGLDVMLTLAEPHGDRVSRVLRRRTVGTIGALIDPTSQEFSAVQRALCRRRPRGADRPDEHIAVRGGEHPPSSSSC